MKKRRYIYIMLVVAIIVGFCIPTQNAYAADNSYIKVKLTSMGSVSSVSFKLNGNYFIAENPYYPLIKGNTYTIKTSGDGVKLIDGNSSTYIGLNATFTRCESGSSSNFLTLNHTKTGWTNYPGDLTFKRSGSYIDTICKMFIETYLVGVVAHEMSPSWPVEALKAQSVAARTYAMRYINPGNTYDVVDTTSNQVYKGYDPSRDAPVVSAVNATKGQVLLWNGVLADGVYSASNGGQTMTRVPKWGSVNYYHQLKDDPYDKANPASPRFTFVFPKLITTTNSIDYRLDQKIRDLSVSKLAAQGVNASASNITIMSIESLNPHTLPSANSYGAYPTGSYQYTKVDVGVVVDYSGDAIIPVQEDTSNIFITTGIVTLESSSRMRIRGDASTSSDIVGYISNGAELEVYDIRNDGWLKIKYGDINGYVMASYINLAPYEDNTTTDFNIPATISTDDGTIYDNSSTSSGVNAVLNKDEALIINNIVNSQWAKVTYNSTTGFIQLASLAYDVSLLPSGWQGENVVEGQRITVTLDFSELKTMFGSDSSYLKYHKLLSVEESSDGTTFLLVASRYGHGIGMSQRGAQQMAYDGLTYVDILNFYYNGTVLNTVNVHEAPLPTSAVMSDISAVATSDNINVRKGPGTSYGVIASLDKNERVYVLVVDTWSQVYVPSDHVVGYVSSDYLDITYPEIEDPVIDDDVQSHEGVFKVTASKLNFRSAPLIANNIYYTLSYGTQVKKIGQSTDFYQVIDPSGKTGWCSSAYLEQIGPAVTPPPENIPTPSPSPTISQHEIPYVAYVNTQDNVSLRVYEYVGENAPVIGMLASADIVNVTERVDDGYVHVNNDGIDGYAKEIYLSVVVAQTTPSPSPTTQVTPTPSPTNITPSPSPTADPNEGSDTNTGKVTTSGGSSLRIRNDVSTSSEILGYIPNGGIVEIKEIRNDRWLKIGYRNIIGYVSATYITYEQIEVTPTATIPTVTPSPTAVAPTETPVVTATPPTSTPSATPEVIKSGVITLESSLSLRVRSSDSTSSSIIGYISNNTQIEIIEVLSNGWIQMDDGVKSGFVKSSYVNINDSSVILSKVIDCQWLNIREQSNTSSNIISMVKVGKLLKIIDETDDWYKIEHKEIIGWVSSEYIEKILTE